MRREQLTEVRAYAKTAEYAVTSARMRATEPNLKELADRAALAIAALIGACDKRLEQRALAGAAAELEVR